MENQPQTGPGSIMMNIIIYFCLSVTWFVQNIEPGLKIILTLVGILAGFYQIRERYFTTKHKKMEIKKLEEENARIKKENSKIKKEINELKNEN